MTFRTRTGIRLASIGVCASALLLAGCMGNSLQTADRGLDPLGDPLVALGLKPDPDRELIEYGPRAPLVIPANSELPPPEQRLADHGLDWPDDPDRRARREYEEARQAAASQGVRDVEQASRRMSRAELDEWGRRFGRVSEDPPRGSQRDPGRPVSPEELRSRTASADAVGAEPPRRRLVEPPAGYRRPADIGEVEAEAEEEGGFFSRLFTGRRGPPPPRDSSDPQYDPRRDR